MEVAQQLHLGLHHVVIVDKAAAVLLLPLRRGDLVARDEDHDVDVGLPKGFNDFQTVLIGEAVVSGKVVALCQPRPHRPRCGGGKMQCSPVWDGAGRGCNARQDCRLLMVLHHLFSWAGWLVPASLLLLPDGTA